MKPTQPKIVGFNFQVIAMEDAKSYAMAGSGNYAELKARLLETLPTLEPTQAFSFGLPNGKEVAEDQRRAIVLVLNSTLKKAKLPWRVTYSGVKKVFLCVPPDVPRNYEKSRRKDPAQEQSSLRLPPEKTKMSHANAINQMESLIVQATRIFGMSLKEIQEAKAEKRVVRKALCVVASEQEIHPKIIGRFVGLTADGVRYNAQSNSPYGKDEIKTLREAIGG